MRVIGVNVRMEAIRGNQAYFLPKNTAIIKETKGHNVEVGHLMGYDPKTNDMLVKTQDSDQIQKWVPGKNISTVKDYAVRKEHQLSVASELIAALATRKAISSESQKLNLLA